MHALARRLHARVIAVGLLLSLLLLPLHSMAGDLWSDTPPSPSILKELERYKAATSPEERAAAVARLEQLGESEPEAWNQLGIEYRLAKPANPQLAEAMFVKAAAAKSLNGLMNVIAVRIGDGRIAESCKAAEAARAWPDGAGAPAIAYLGECYRLGRNGPKDAAKAEPLLMEACRWGWEPACDSAIASLQSNPTPARKIAYLAFLEKLAGSKYPPAVFHLATELGKSQKVSDQNRSLQLLDNASAAGHPEACLSLALILSSKGDVNDRDRIEGLLDCGDNGKQPELASLIRGVMVALYGDEDRGRALLVEAFQQGLQQAGAVSLALGYPAIAGADPTRCDPFCDWIETIRDVQRTRLEGLWAAKNNKLVIDDEMERWRRQLSSQAERQAVEPEASAPTPAMNPQIMAQNEQPQQGRKGRFWRGVLYVAIALATGYVQGQANAIANNNARPAPVYVPPSISAPYRPVYQQPASSVPVGRTQICYIQTPQGMQAITVNASQGCPVSLQSMGQPLRANGTGYLVGESVSGLIKICLYSGAAGQSSINISASGVCPPSHQY